MNTLAKIIVSGLISLASLFGYVQPEQQFTAGSTFTPAQSSQTTLSGAGVTATQTTIPLTSFVTPSGLPLTMSMFGSIGYAVIEPNTNKIEDISFTGITQNANGTAVLTGVTRGMDFVSPYAASSTLQKAHAGGSYLIVSNSPGFYGQQFALTNGNSAIGGLWTFTDPPILTNAATSTKQAASIAYVNGIAYGTSTILKGYGGTGVTGFGTGAFVYDSGVGTTLSGTTSPTFGYITATSTSGTSTIAGALNVSGSTSLGSTTMTATTSIAASSVTNNALKLNGLNYAFPSSRGSSGAVLTENGSGSLSWASPSVPRYVLNETTDLSVTGGYATSTSQITIPANTLTASSTIRFEFGNATCLNTVGSGSCEVYIKTSTGTTLAGGQFSNDSNSYNTDPASGFMTISSNNYTNFSSQVTTGQSSFVRESTPSSGQLNELSGTSSVDFTQTITLKVVMRCDSSTTGSIGFFSIVVNP